jgi:hypothetical protein
VQRVEQQGREPLDGDVVIEDWKNIPAGTESWQSATLSAKDMTYPEGGTVPYRLTMPQPCVGGTWSITLQYDFLDESNGVHFVDFLTSYNAYEGSVNGKGCIDNSCSSEMNYAIPADASLSYQLPGVFTVENGAITSVSAYSTGHERRRHPEVHHGHRHRHIER